MENKNEYNSNSTQWGERYVLAEHYRKHTEEYAEGEGAWMSHYAVNSFSLKDYRVVL